MHNGCKLAIKFSLVTEYCRGSRDLSLEMKYEAHPRHFEMTIMIL